MKKSRSRKLFLAAGAALVAAALWLLPPSAPLFTAAHAESAQQNPSRPRATKSSNTWICLVVCGITGIIVYFIGQAERREQQLREQEWERQEKERSRKKEGASDGEEDAKKESQQQD